MNIKSQLLSIAIVLMHIDPNYGLFMMSVKSFYVAWRVGDRLTIRKFWVLPNTTHCKYLQTINNSLPIDLMLEQDAREAMRVVFFCTYKTYLYAQNEISYEYIQILF